MLQLPFDIINCSWPHPVEHANNRWTPEPEWNVALTLFDYIYPKMNGRYFE